jgi:hypothetical protein
MSRRQGIPKTQRGIIRYYCGKGYRCKPLLAGSKGEDLWFTKHLPDGRQSHVRVWLKNRKCLKIEKHIDRADPYQHPVSHVVKDIVNPFKVKHKKQYLAKRKRQTTSKRKARSRNWRLF